MSEQIPNDSSQRNSKVSRVVNSGWTLFVAVIFIGPLALPLLWRNPRFGKKFKIAWSFIIVLITVFCLWALKFSATLLSNAVAAEPCRLERHRPAYPPGTKITRVYSKADKPQTFEDPKAFFEYLKSIDGKACDVNWLEAKKEIEEWLTLGWDSAESTVGPELDALIYKQKNGNQAQAPATDHIARLAPNPPLSQVSQSAPVATNCADQLSGVRTRLSSLKAKAYDSQTIRAAEIESILRSLDPGALK